MPVKIGIRFHRAKMTYFELNILYAYIKQNIMQMNSVLIKVQV